MAACKWFARCTRKAVKAVDHPVLGRVHCCQRCADFATSDDRSKQFHLRAAKVSRAEQHLVLRDLQDAAAEAAAEFCDTVSAGCTARQYEAAKKKIERIAAAIRAAKGGK